MNATPVVVLPLPGMSSLHAAKMSLEEWYALPEDTPGELVDGRLEEEEVPGFAHELIVSLLNHYLTSWGLPRGAFVAGSEGKYRIGPQRGRKPDLVVYFPDSRAPQPEGLIDIPPDIAVEVVSPRPRDVQRDRVAKMDDYATFGVRYYWIVDPDNCTFEIFELGKDRRYARALGVAGGTIDPVPGCDGLRLDVGALWSQVERLKLRHAEA